MSVKLIVSLVIIVLCILYNIFLNKKDTSSGGGFFPNMDLNHGVNIIISIIIALILLVITSYAL